VDWAIIQPCVLFPDQVLDGDFHVVEEDLAELGLAGGLLDGADGHARRLHVEDEVADAGVLLRRVGIGAG
jgi:hypothetical protein